MIYLREHEIELAVERMIDRLDARYVADCLTEEEYNKDMDEIKAWADKQYDILARTLSPIC